MRTGTHWETSTGGPVLLSNDATEENSMPHMYCTIAREPDAAFDHLNDFIVLDRFEQHLLWQSRSAERKDLVSQHLMVGRLRELAGWLDVHAAASLCCMLGPDKLAFGQIEQLAAQWAGQATVPDKEKASALTEMHEAIAELGKFLSTTQ